VEGFFEWVELSEKRGLDPIACFVTRPETVSKRLDDVIGRNADVYGAAFDHFEQRVEHAYDSTIGSILALVEAAQTVEVPEQLVGSIHDVNDHIRCTADSVAAPLLTWPWLLQ
jgi:hypothetical protein